MAEDGGMHGLVTVVAYDPLWPQQFERLRGQVDVALAGVRHVTVHIGSTAVSGLAAKPIIDLDAVVADRAGVAAAIGALTAAGWRHEGDLGIPGRDAFHPRSGEVYHHLYVVVDGGPAYRDHVDLRDFLRGHPAQAARYAALKRQLAPLLETDRIAYVQGKADLIAELLRQARRADLRPDT
jgi:GrpB-like predicted nucleotidyltransferase (UPF0157 family)